MTTSDTAKRQAGALTEAELAHAAGGSGYPSGDTDAMGRLTETDLTQVVGGSDGPGGPADGTGATPDLKATPILF